MSITSKAELLGMQKVGEAVGTTLKKMRDYARPGMTTQELDNFGRSILDGFGAKSAPKLTYGFPGHTCISINHEVAHGIPSEKKIMKEGDLINIDVSAELNGYWGDNGGSFVLGRDIHHHKALVDGSRKILLHAIRRIRGGVRIADIGRYIETEARRSGFRVIRNLVGHGIGRSLHEDPKEIPCYHDRFNLKRFKTNSVIAIETFISTNATYAYEQGDGWTLMTRDGSFVAQHEHTVLVTKNEPIILTSSNEI
jgi:methionyl aminopeptidase